MKVDRPIEIHPQRCYDCGTALKEGEQALASRNFPLAFCLKCRKESKEFMLVTVKSESSDQKI